jgi:hypothetical protein
VCDDEEDLMHLWLCSQSDERAMHSLQLFAIGATQCIMHRQRVKLQAASHHSGVGHFMTD